MLLLIFALTLMMVDPQGPASSQSLLPAIREQIRQQGHAEIVLTLNYPPTDLDDLTAKADLIVEATTGLCQSYFTKDEAHVYTGCNMTVRNVLKGSITEGGGLVVRRNGGALMVDGASVVVRESHFPPFAKGERYVLFLVSVDGSYIVLYGAEGAFKSLGNG